MYVRLPVVEEKCMLTASTIGTGKQNLQLFHYADELGSVVVVE